MGEQQTSSNETNQFLEDVIEQIQYKPIRTEIKEELKAHIEDHTLELMENGMEEKEATQIAIEQMGDPTSIGIMLNKVRSVKNHWVLIGMLLAAISMGILNNFMYYNVDWESGYLYGIGDILFNLNYFIFGLIIFIVIYLKGYTFVVKHEKLICISFIVIFLVEKFFGRFVSYTLKRYFPFHVLEYGFLLILGPLLAIVLYKWGNKGIKTLLAYTIILNFIIILQYNTLRSYSFTAILTLLITSTASLLYMIYKGYLLGNKKKLFFYALLSIFITLGIYGTISFPTQKRNLQLFFSPEKQATNHWEDGYNGVLIKELLRKAEPFGTIKLTQEELMDYGTGAWYFDEEEVANITKYRHYNISNVTFEDILPQHYHNNYRFTFWILNYGWIPAIILITFVIGLFTTLFVVSSKIKNKLGAAIAFSCGVCLTIQMIIYLLGNFGYQYGSFSTLPFISEGLGSITINMTLIGMILSAYRYDNVIKEDSCEFKKPDLNIARLIVKSK